MQYPRRLLLMIVVALSLTLGACIGTGVFYVGKGVKAEHAVALEEAIQQEATWETFDLTVNYRAVQEGDVLEMKGEVKLSQHFTMNYARLSRLDVYVLALDKDLRVLESSRLNLRPTIELEYPIGFTASLPLPSDTTSISFAYNGVAREGGTRDGGTSAFWLLPQ